MLLGSGLLILGLSPLLKEPVDYSVFINPPFKKKKEPYVFQMGVPFGGILDAFTKICTQTRIIVSTMHHMVTQAEIQY